jgi:hypothetical protein
MHSAGTGSSAGQNLAALRYKAAKLNYVLIVYKVGLVSTELANLPAFTDTVSLLSVFIIAGIIIVISHLSHSLIVRLNKFSLPAVAG